MKYVVLAGLAAALMMVSVGCTPDVGICTTYCGNEIGCMDLDDGEAAAAFKRACIAYCSVDVSKGGWSADCDEWSDEGTCEEWDTDSEIDPEDYKAFYQCLVDFSECVDKSYYIEDEDDQEECWEHLD